MSITHTLYQNTNGTFSLKNIASGEVMHSTVGPFEEAKLLYIEQSNLHERLSLRGKTAVNPLILFDVGLGAATNALGAIQCYLKHADPCSFTIYSFENDLSGAHLALENATRFPFFEGVTDEVRKLLSEGKTTIQHPNGSKLNWLLHTGNFEDQIENLPNPDIIFWDLYSPRTNSHVWTPELFQRLKAVCSDSTLYTYSASTRVRVAMLLGGFYVGYGRNTGAKRETTIASTHFEYLEKPLDNLWTERFKKSHEPIPYGYAPERKEEVFEKILSNPQFQNVFVTDLLGDIDRFLVKILFWMQENKVDISECEIDHICYRVTTLAQYEEMKIKLLTIANPFHEAMIAGRPIAVFKLHKPWSFAGQKFSFVELPAPKEGLYTHTGLEHVEFVTKKSFETLQKENPELNWDTSSIAKAHNPELKLPLDPKKRIVVKFHHQSLENVILAEKKLI